MPIASIISTHMKIYNVGHDQHAYSDIISTHMKIYNVGHDQHAYSDIISTHMKIYNVWHDQHAYRIISTHMKIYSVGHDQHAYSDIISTHMKIYNVSMPITSSHSARNQHLLILLLFMMHDITIILCRVISLIRHIISSLCKTFQYDLNHNTSLRTLTELLEFGMPEKMREGRHSHKVLFAFHESWQILDLMT